MIEIALGFLLGGGKAMATKMIFGIFERYDWNGRKTLDYGISETYFGLIGRALSLSRNIRQGADLEFENIEANWDRPCLIDSLPT